MNLIDQRSADQAFSNHDARNVTIVRRDERQWYFTFESAAPYGTPTVYALRTQRGGLRTWADPRSLFAFLHSRYGVSRGNFLLQEDSPNETPDS